MMQYQNPKIPEGINVSKEHPLEDFFMMLLSVTVALVLLIAIVFYIAEWLVRFIPFEAEITLVEHTGFGKTSTHDDNNKNIESYLQTLVDRLSDKQQLPDNIFVTVHYVDDDMVNAFATLGGNIIVYRGLLEKMPHENALSMVLAHEIAHIKHRDPVVAMGRAVTIGFALTSILGAVDSSLGEMFINQVNFFTAMAFNRQQEQEADDEALQTLLNYYGHVEGAEYLFEELEKIQGFEPPGFLSSHPVHENRIENINKIQQLNKTTEDFIPLPEFINTDSVN